MLQNATVTGITATYNADWDNATTTPTSSFHVGFVSKFNHKMI
jgi:hypothetical protein